MGCSRVRRGGETIFAGIVAGACALSLFAAGASAKLIPKSVDACNTLFNQAVDAVDAIPFTRKIMDRTLSKGWLARFDPNLYRQMKEQYLAAENMGLEQWGFAESRLAYLSALVERATGMKITLADMFLDDPTHARSLQLLARNVDFSKNLTRYQLEQVIERAFLLTGKLDLKLSDLGPLLTRKESTERLKTIMKEHARKEMAKVGVTKLYADMNLLVYTKKEVAEMIKRGAIQAGSEEAKNLRIEANLSRWMRIYDDPRIQGALLLPTWNPSTMAAKLRPGVLPKVQWVRFDAEELRGMLEVGVDEYIRTHHLEPRLRKALATQRSYDFVRHVVAIWAGVLTFGYALGQLFDMDAQQVQDWIAKQGKHAMKDLQAEFERNPLIPPLPQAPNR